MEKEKTVISIKAANGSETVIEVEGGKALTESAQALTKKARKVFKEARKNGSSEEDLNNVRHILSISSALSQAGKIALGVPEDKSKS